MRVRLGPRGTGLTVVACLVALAVAILWSQSQAPPDPGLFRYDLSRFAATDPSRVGYREVDSLAVAGETLRGLARAAAGELLVAVDRHLAVLAPDGTELKRVALPEPALCVAVDRGRVLLGMRQRVAVLETLDADLVLWPELGQNAWLTSVAVARGQVYAADAGQRRVWRFDREGRLVGFIDGPPADPDAGGKAGFVVPSPYFDLATGPDEGLWIANPGRQRVERYDPDGRLKAHWGQPGMDLERFSGCCNPSHFAILPGGGFVTSEKGLPRVKTYTADGTFHSVVAGPEAFAPGVVGLDLTGDPVGGVYVLDPDAVAVRVFVPKGAQE